jgi:hypothetical protein
MLLLHGSSRCEGFIGTIDIVHIHYLGRDDDVGTVRLLPFFKG